MTPQIFLYEYQKYAEFYADSKPIEITGKNGTQKKLCQKVLQISTYKLQFCTVVLHLTFLLANYSHFPSNFEISIKFRVVLKPSQILRRNSF